MLIMTSVDYGPGEIVCVILVTWTDMDMFLTNANIKSITILHIQHLYKNAYL